MKGCELCNLPATIYCESDQASLCWECDEKVHCANFLVAKHSRILLCQTCQSSTPWKASGPKLCPAFSICETCCVHKCNLEQERDAERNKESLGINEDDYIEYEEEISSSDDEHGDCDDEEEGIGNQVVPWSTTLPQSY